MSFKVDDLKAQMPSGGARANLFRVTFAEPGVGGTGMDVNQLSFLCKAAALPAGVIGQIDVPFRGRQLKVAGDRTFENWTATIINENDFKARNTFERWMSSINEHVEGTGNGDQALYYANVTVEQLDRSNNTVKTYQLKDAFPVNLSAVDLSYDTTDAIEEFTVEFAYQYWVEDKDTTDGNLA
jgi:hypothetical protein